MGPASNTQKTRETAPAKKKNTKKPNNDTEEEESASVNQTAPTKRASSKAVNATSEDNDEQPTVINPRKRVASAAKESSRGKKIQKKATAEDEDLTVTRKSADRWISSVNTETI